MVTVPLRGEPVLRSLARQPLLPAVVERARAELEQRLASVGCAPASDEAHVEVGDPAERIIALAEHWEAELVVVAARRPPAEGLGEVAGAVVS